MTIQNEYEAWKVIDDLLEINRGGYLNDRAYHLAVHLVKAHLDDIEILMAKEKKECK